MILDRKALVDTAANSIKRGSKSFALASHLFDRQTRERAWLLYFWCRTCDDMADGQDHGGAMHSIANAEAVLEYLSAQTELALAGTQTAHPAFDALGLVVRECNIPHHLPRDLIKGFALDAQDWRPRTEADLLLYCYHVAGVVGVMMAIIMGIDPADKATLKHASDLGTAFQLANIARDIEEDDGAGRCYLPLNWLVELDIGPGEQMKPHYRGRLSVIAKWLSEMAEEYEASARIGARQLPFRSRWAVLAAAGIYGDIAREVRKRGDSAWDHRVVISRWAKFLWVVKAFGQAIAGG